MTSTFQVGDKVEFGRTHGEKTLGVVKAIGRTGKLKIAQLEERGMHRTRPAGTVWTVPADPRLVRKVGGTAEVPAKPTLVPPLSAATSAARRPDAQIMGEFLGIYCAMSPENLSCDGELSRAQVQARYASLKARLKALAAEFGRMVSEDEAYRWSDARRRTA